MPLIDIIVIVAIGAYAIVGLTRGFIRSLFDLLKYVFALVVAILLYKAFANFMCELIVVEGLPLNEYYINGLQKTLEAEGGIFVAAPDGYNTENVALALADAGIPTFFANILNPIIVSALSGVTVGLAETVATFVVNTAIFVISFIFLYLLASVILTFISNAVYKLFARSHMAVTTDRILGFVFGFLQGVVVIWLALMFIGLISGVWADIQNLIEQSTIAKFLQENNLIVLILTSNFNLSTLLS